MDDLDYTLRLLRRMAGSIKSIPPWAFFVCSLSMISIVLTRTESSNRYFCAASDDSGIACLRNWINAVGTTASVTVAAIAAVFVLGQMRLTRDQLLTSSIPFLDKRISNIADVDLSCQNAIMALNCVRLSAVRLSELLASDTEGKKIYQGVVSFYSELERFSKTQMDVSYKTENLNIDADIRVFAENLWIQTDLSISYHYRMLISGQGHIGPNELNSFVYYQSDGHLYSFIGEFRDRDSTVDRFRNMQKDLCGFRDGLSSRIDEIRHTRQALKMRADATSAQKILILSRNG